jgi:hypothetical protein
MWAHKITTIISLLSVAFIAIACLYGYVRRPSFKPLLLLGIVTILQALNCCLNVLASFRLDLFASWVLNSTFVTHLWFLGTSTLVILQAVGIAWLVNSLIKVSTQEDSIEDKEGAQQSPAGDR